MWKGHYSEKTKSEEKDTDKTDSEISHFLYFESQINWLSFQLQA